jgi:hypothetical protein
MCVCSHTHTTYYYCYAMYVAGYVWIGNEFEGVDDAEDEEVLLVA